MTVAGADGCRGGWVVSLYDGARHELETVSHIDGVLERCRHAAALGVDMPVHLRTDGEPRACDREAKRILAHRASTIFPAPALPLLNCQTYAEALETSRRLFGRGLSVQTYHLFPKIREIQGREGLLEMHPELAFLLMNQRRPLPAKKTADGRDLRRRLLGWAVVPKLAGTQPDDVLDAAAVAWSAWRYAQGKAVPLGEPPSLIWY